MRKDGRTKAVWLDHTTAEKIERISRKLGMTDSHLMKNLLLCGLQDAELLEKMGVLTLAMLLRKAKENMEQTAEEGMRIMQNSESQEDGAS